MIQHFLHLKKNLESFGGVLVFPFSFLFLISFNKTCKLLNCSFINSVIKYHLGSLPKVETSAFSNREILIDSSYRKSSLQPKLRLKNLEPTMTCLDESFSVKLSQTLEIVMDLGAFGYRNHEYSICFQIEVSSLA